MISRKRDACEIESARPEVECPISGPNLKLTERVHRAAIGDLPLDAMVRREGRDVSDTVVPHSMTGRKSMARSCLIFPRAPVVGWRRVAANHESLARVEQGHFHGGRLCVASPFALY